MKTGGNPSALVSFLAAVTVCDLASDNRASAPLVVWSRNARAHPGKLERDVFK